MWNATITEDDLRRFREEREQGDRQYNDALTALDAALVRLPSLPDSLPPIDQLNLQALDDLCRVAATDPSTALSGWRRRLAGFVWRVVGPMLQQQQAFNASLVEQLHRGGAAARDTRGALAATIEQLTGHFAAAERFQARLIRYLQAITLFVDTKDRDEAAMIRDRVDRVNNRATGLAAALSGLADDLRLRWESMVAREQRFETRVASVQGAYNELRTTLATLQQTSTVLRREMQRLLERAAAVPADEPGVRHAATPGTAGMPGPADEATAALARDVTPWPSPGAAAAQVPPRDGAPGPAPEAVASQAQRPEARPLARPPAGCASIDAAVDSHKYIGFEDLFRGPRDEIRGRLADYLPLFAGASNVLDLGCGRGEFLELLREEGITARGVDLNDEMVELCRARGLDVVGADALAYLEACPDGSIGGILAAQVIEHLDPAVIVRLLDVALTKLEPGGHIVVETINPACWFAFFESYIRDLTHVRPVHPDTLKFLLQASGFQRVEIRFRAPFPEGDKLQPVSVPSIDAALVPELPVLKDLAMTFNANIDKLNGLLFTHLDYAAIGERL